MRIGSGNMLFAFLFVVAVLSLVAWLTYQRLKKTEDPLPRVNWAPQEKTFQDPRTGAQYEFPSISDKPSLTLTVVVPAYNEQYRISPMLDVTIEHLERKHEQNAEFTYEIIVVDDCSKDNTIGVVMDYISKIGVDKLRLLRLAQNRGKGGAIRRGVLCARGRYILFADADGASRFSDVDKLELQLKKNEVNELGVSIGSRHSNQNEDLVRVEKSIFRKILSKGFATLLNVLGVKGINDTQCGFKLFSRRAAKLLFSLMHIERFAFDVELLVLARKFDIPIVEVPISWVEIAGSTVDPIWDSLKMARDLLKIRVMYYLGIWSSEPLYSA